MMPSTMPPMTHDASDNASDDASNNASDNASNIASMISNAATTAIHGENKINNEAVRGKRKRKRRTIINLYATHL